MILIDYPTVFAEKKDSKWERDYFLLGRRQILINYIEWVLYII